MIAKFQISYFYKAGAKDILHYYIILHLHLCVCLMRVCFKVRNTVFSIPGKELFTNPGDYLFDIIM